MHWNFTLNTYFRLWLRRLIMQSRDGLGCNCIMLESLCSIQMHEHSSAHVCAPAAWYCRAEMVWVAITSYLKARAPFKCVNILPHMFMPPQLDTAEQRWSGPDAELWLWLRGSSRPQSGGALQRCGLQFREQILERLEEKPKGRDW